MPKTTEQPRISFRNFRHARAAGACLFAVSLLSGGAYAANPDAGFSTSFEADQPVPTATAKTAVRIETGAGPAQPYAAKPEVGYSGLRALRYVANGAGGRTRLFDVDVPIGPGTQLSWMVFPEIVDADTVASTGVSLDVVLDDGRRLSALPLRDQHGSALGAQAQADSKTLYPQQWARKSIAFDGMPALQGRRIVAIELEVAPVDGARAAGWIDDIVIEDVPAQTARRPIDYVSTTRGTQSNGVFSRGNNIPATAMPHGFNFWVPVTDAGTLSWLYRWSEHNGADNRPRLQALSISHQPSPWMGDRQTFQIMPSVARGVPEADRERRALSFSREKEIAKPHLYGVTFDNGIHAELTPTERAALFRFRFPEGEDANLLFDNVDARGGLTLDAATQTLSGYTDTRSRLSNGATRMFVYARFDQPWTGSGMIETGRPTGYIKFAPGGEVHMRIATSLVSVEQAKRNLELEIGNAGFDAVRDRADAAWSALLDRVKLQGANEDALTTVYSNLYRLFLYPNVAHENLGTAARPDWRHADQNSWSSDNTGGDAMRTSAAVRAGKVYVNNGFWDTFRTTWPAYALFAPERAGEMVDGFLQQYRDGGWVARWSSPGYADLMVGTSSDVAFADAWLKGVRGFDGDEAYEAALRNATVVPPVSNVGRKGLTHSMYRGHADTGVHEGLSWTLEGALNDFGIANMGQALADTSKDPARAQRYRDEAAYFRARAATYVNLFDADTRHFRGRKADGGWREPAADFDPRLWGGDYTEANAWTFAFTAAHDGAGLATLYGGRDAFAARLDEFFATPETAEERFAGTYTRVIHEMTEARDVRMGMYAHSNQPAHHIPWLYVFAGQPWKTQAIGRKVMQRLYLGSEIGQGYPGDEDNGEMSAWYLFAMLGLYPLRMGTDEYVIGSPAFERAEVRLDNDRTLTVIAHGNSSENVYVQSLTVNGTPWNHAWLRHADIADGATLEFTMGPSPSQWASGDAALPPSLTAAGKTPVQLRDQTGRATAHTCDGSALGPGLLDDDAATAESLAPDACQLFAFDAALDAGFYTLTVGDAPQVALGWTLEARTGTDGEWVELDRRTNEAFQWAHQLRPFRIARPDAYREYRLRLQSDAPLSLAEFELLRTDDAPQVQASGGRLR